MQYVKIEFNAEREELAKSFFTSYRSIPYRKTVADAVGMQIQKKHKKGYWFPINEKYL